MPQQLCCWFWYVHQRIVLLCYKESRCEREMTEVKREMKEKEKSMNQTKLSVSNLDLYYGNFMR